jgi:phosphoribosyl 1,2-cyclic phosphate phosphodiesterase
MLPLPVPHGHVDVYGFRVGALGYITDAKRLPERTRAALEGVRVLVLNALWFGNPHPTHFTVEEAVEVALEIGAERPSSPTSATGSYGTRAGGAAAGRHRPRTTG